MKKIAGVAVLLFATGCSSNTSSPTTVVDTTMVTTTTVKENAPLVIDVIVGENSGDERIEVIDIGTPITITLTNPTDADEYHLHGYDIVSKKMDAGMTATLSFTASQAGTFELESHITSDVLLILEIS